MCRMSGADFWARIVHAGLTIATAFVFAFAMIGLTLGTALAQILLGVLVMFLPLLLLAAAIPMKSTKGLLRRIMVMAITAMFAHAIFLFVLALMVLMMDILIEMVLASTAPGDVQRTIFLAAMPLIVKWIIGKLSKQINPNLDMSGIKGTMKLTSGLAAGAMGGDMGANRARHYGNRVSRMASSAMIGVAGGRGLRLAPAAAAAGGAVGAAGAVAGAAGGAGPKSGRGGGLKNMFSHMPYFGSKPTASKPPPSSPVVTPPGPSSPVVTPPSSPPLSSPVVTPPGPSSPVVTPPSSPPLSSPVVTPPPGRSPLIGDTQPAAPASIEPAGSPRRSSYRGGESDVPGWDRKYDPSHGWYNTRAEQPEPAPTTVGDGTVSETSTAREPAAAETGESSEATEPLTRGERATNIARGSARFMRKHALATFAVAGALTGVGLPAAAIVYAGGKVVKRSARLPTKAVGALAGKGKVRMKGAREQYRRNALEETANVANSGSSPDQRLTPRAVGPGPENGDGPVPSVG